MNISKIIQAATKPLGKIRFWPKTFSQKMLMTAEFTGIFLALLPLSYPFAVFMLLKGGALSMTGALTAAGGILGTIGAVGAGLNALLDLSQYGLNPNKPLRYTN